MKFIELKPIRETKEDYDRLESEILRALRQEIYLPLLKDLPQKRKVLLKNSREDLVDAIRSGQISFYRGRFRGKFNSQVSKEIKKLGGIWDKGSWKISLISLPIEIENTIRASVIQFEKAMERIDKKLSDADPAKIADSIRMEKIFSSHLWKVEKEFNKSITNLIVSPSLSPYQIKTISEEYSNNLKLFVKNFAEKEIKSLRAKIKEETFQGRRYEAVVLEIQKSYGVSHNKAKFLARQETNLLMTKFKKSRYIEAGVNKYKWGCVVGTVNHPVRPRHKVLEGRIFLWKEPPVTDNKGNRNNPGEDYNCRCFARPIVDF